MKQPPHPAKSPSEGTAEDKRDHIQDLIRLAKGISTKLPYEPSRREREKETA